MANLSPRAALMVASTGFFALTLNWFDVSAAFPLLAHRFHLGVNGLSILVSLFLAGYGIFHIPAGLLVRRYGLRVTVVSGLLLEAVSAGLIGSVANLALLEVLRLMAGAGAALIMGAELALVTWSFRSRHLVIAQAIGSSAIYSLGALAGLGWSFVIARLGLALSFQLAGAAGLAIAAIHWYVLSGGVREPVAQPTNTWRDVRRVLSHKNLWWVGLGAMGGYGSYFTLAQLGPTYLTASGPARADAIGYAGLILIAAGVPGAIWGGVWADRWHSRKAFIVGSATVIAALLFNLPFLPRSATPWVFAAVGFSVMAARPAYTAFPGDDRGHIQPEDIATAEGLLFTLLSAGAALFPLLWSLVHHILGATSAWEALGLATLATALLGLPIRDVAVLNWAATRSRLDHATAIMSGEPPVPKAPES